jgi:hypothetical protein
MSEASQNDGKVAKPICDNGKIPNFSTHTHYGTFMARAPSACGALMTYRI